MEITKKFERYTTLRILAERGALQHSVATPVDLVDEMIAIGGKCLTEDAKILVMFNVEFAVSLSEDFPWTKDNITLFTNGDPTLQKLAQKMGINTIESLETDMKFDLGLANPPFSEGQGNKLLYPKFFKNGLDICEHIIMVMPINLDSRDNKLKSHNELILKHQDHVSEDVSSHFSGVHVGQISYVFASKSTKNEYTLPEERKLPRILPKRERMKVINGRAFDSVERGCEVIHKVHKDGIVYGKCNKAHRDSFNTYYKKHADLSLPWMVMINHTPSKGKFNCEVVKYSPDMVWSRWVYAIQAKTKKEANEIVEHLHSNKIVGYLNEHMTSHTVSKTILEALPSHVG